MAFKKANEKVFVDLKKRNDIERRFEDVVKLCVSLHEDVDFLEKENDRLRAQKSKLETENLNCEHSPDITKTNKSLLKKIYDLQTELAELHKNKGDHAEEIILLRRSLDEKERDLKLRTEELDKTRAALLASKEKKEYFADKALEAENNLQLVQDEYAALLLTYSSLEKTKEKLEKEHNEMISRWLVYKAKEAEDTFAEKELVQRIKETNLQKELEDAIQEPFGVNPGCSNITYKLSLKS